MKLRIARRLLRKLPLPPMLAGTISKRRTMLLTAILALALSGCRSEPEPSPEPLPQSSKIIRIAVPDQTYFTAQYLPFFDAKFPDWEIELLDLSGMKLYTKAEPTMTDELAAFLEREKPDLLLANYLEYGGLADRELLRDLEPWMARAGIDERELAPGLIAELRNNAHNKLYGVSPSFSTSALYYNKTMFRALGIPEPAEPMTWRETLELSVRFMQDKRMDEGAFGIHQIWIGSPEQLIDSVAAAEGLQYVDDKTRKMTIATPEWAAVWETVLDAYRNGAFAALPEDYKVVDGEAHIMPEDIAKRDLFSQGLAAMTTDHQGLMQQLLAKPPAFEWGVVAGPVGSRDRSRAGRITPDLVLAVPVAASQPELAWEALAYFWSEELGKVYASTDRGLSARVRFPEWKNDPQYGEFYRMQAWSGSARRATADMQRFYRQYLKLPPEQFALAAKGEIPIAQALDTLQREGQAILDSLDDPVAPETASSAQ